MSEVVEVKKVSKFKKYSSITWRTLKYPLIYLIVQFVVTFGVGIFYAIKYYSKLSQGEIEEVIISSILSATAFAAILSLFVFILLFKKKEETLWKRCGFEKINLNKLLFIAIISIGTSMFSVSFVNLVLPMFPSYGEVSETLGAGLNSIFGIVSMVIIIPAFEEVLFRGLVFNELKKNINIYASFIIQALVFAAFHGNMLQGIYTFILGIILASVYVWTRSILAPIIIHVLYNFMGTMVFPYLLTVVEGITIIMLVCGIFVSAIGILFLYRSRIQEECV